MGRAPSSGAVLAPPSFLDVLPEVGRDHVLAVARRATFARQAVVVRQGEAATSLYVVERGSLAVRFTTPAGDSVMLAVMGAGDVVGEVGVLLEPQQRTASIEAIDDVVVRVLQRDDFDTLRARHPEVNDFLLVLLARRTDRLSRLVAEAHYLPVDKRVARRLLEAGRHFSTGRLPVVIPLAQEDIAQLAGTTRPTANQVLKRMEADGVIALARGRVEILDVAGLRERCR